jgi:hypothetical protein
MGFVDTTMLYVYPVIYVAQKLLEKEIFSQLL